MTAKKDAPADATPDAPPADAPVTMADVAAINGIGLAPDESEVDEPARAMDEPAPFISEGMRIDLEQQGWVIDPNTGKRIERQ